MDKPIDEMNEGLQMSDGCIFVTLVKFILHCL